MKLKHLSGPTWELEFGTNAKYLEEFRKIPGLRVLVEAGKVQGWADAVQAAVQAARLDEWIMAPVEEMVPDKRLRKYQNDGVDFLVHRCRLFGGALLADDMGLGKTVQAMTAASHLLVGDDRTIVISPRAACETWREELSKWGFKDAVVLGPPSNTKYRAEWDRSSDARIVVVSFSLAEKAMEIAFDYHQPTLMIVDEAHRVKGRPDRKKNTNKTAQTLEYIRGMVRYAILLSATPQDDRTRDYYQLLKIAGLKFGSQWDFDKRYCGAVPGEHGGLINTGQTNADELKARLHFFKIERRKADVAKDLPPLTRQIRWVDPTGPAIKAYQKYKMGIGRDSLAKALDACLTGKMDEAIEIAKEARRFLLFTKTRSHANQLATLLATEHDTPCVCITGEKDAATRQKLINLAREKKIGIVATLESAAESLNMQNIASVGIMHGIDWRYRVHWQGEGRLHRIGTQDPVVWYYLAMKDSADSDVIRVLLNKLDQARNISGGKDIRSMRDALGDNIDGAGAEKLELDLLKQIYEQTKRQ